MNNLSTNQNAMSSSVPGNDTSPSVEGASFGQEARDQFDKVSKNLVENFGRAGDSLKKYSAQAETLVKENPGVALLAAVSIGCGLGLALGRYFGNHKEPNFSL